MNSGEKSTESEDSSANQARGTAYVRLLAALVGLEAALVSAGAIFFFSQMILQEVNNIAGAIVIFGITALIAIGLWLVSIACWQTKSWTRGAIVTWQILQFAAATSFIQGITQWQPVGWLLAILAVGTFVLTLIPAVAKATTQER